MAIEITKPPAAPVLTATLQAGGELLPNTTYQFRIAAKNTSSYGFGSYNKYQSETSQIISITTTDTQKSIKLEWNYISPYNYYVIIAKRDYDNDYNWKSLQVTSSVNYTKNATSDSQCNMVLDKWDSYSKGGQLNKNGWRLILAQYGYDCPVDRLTGIGRIRIYGGGNGGLTIADLVDAVQSAGLDPERYFKYDGLTLYSRMQLLISSDAAGDLNFKNMNIYPVQCTIFNQSENFSFFNHKARYSVNAWSWRLDTKRIIFKNSVIMGGAASGWKSVNVVLGGDNYVNIYSESNLEKVTILGVRPQVYAGGTAEGMLVISGLNIIGLPSAGKITVKDTQIQDYFFVAINGDLSGYTPGTDYEIRNLWSFDESTSDIRLHYNNKEVTLFDFKGEKGKAVNGSYNKPYVYWSNSNAYNTVLKLLHNFKFVILDKNFDPLAGVNIKIKNANGDEIEITTDANGEAEADFIVATVTHSSGAYGSNYNDYNPIEIEAKKYGYETFKWQGVVEDKKVFELVLNDLELPVAESIDISVNEDLVECEIEEDEITIEVCEQC